MDNLDIEVKSSEKVQSEVSVSENESKAAKEPARINTQATANYISVMSRQKGLLAESSQRTYNQLSSSLNTYVQDPQSVKDIDVDRDSSSLGHYRKLTVQVINRDPSLQEKVAQDLSTSKEMVRSRDAASTLEQNMKKLPDSLSEGVPAGKNLSKLICQSVVNLTDYENMGAGLQRDLAIREVYPPQSELSLRSKIATSDALSASIAYVKSNQPEVLEKLEVDAPVEKPKPGTSTPQIMTRYLRKALDEFPEGSTYLDIFKQNRQKAEAAESETEYNDDISKNTAKRIHDLIHKAAVTARKGNLIPASDRAAQVSNTQAAVADESVKTAAEGKMRDASTLSLSELSARAAKLQQQFREERIRLAAEGKLPDPATRQSLSNVNEQDIKRVDEAFEQKLTQTKAALEQTKPQTQVQSESRTLQAESAKGEQSAAETLKTSGEQPKPEVKAEVKAEIKSEVQSPKSEQAKGETEAQKAETVKSETVKAEQSQPAKTETAAPKVEQVKAEAQAPKSEQVKAETPAPKPENVKAEVSVLKESVVSEAKTALSTEPQAKNAPAAAQNQLSADEIKKLALEAVKEALKESVKTQIEVSQNSAKAAASEVVSELKAQLEASQNNAREMASMVKEALALKAQELSDRTQANTTAEPHVPADKAMSELRQNAQSASEFQSTPVKVSYSTSMGSYGYTSSALFDLSSYHKAQRIADESLVQDFTSSTTQDKITRQQQQLESAQAEERIPDETDKVSTAELLRQRVNEDGTEIEDLVQNEEEPLSNQPVKNEAQLSEEAVALNTESEAQVQSAQSAPQAQPEDAYVNPTAVSQATPEAVPLQQNQEIVQNQAPQSDPNLNRLYSQISTEAQNRILNAAPEGNAPLAEQVPAQPQALVQNTIEQPQNTEEVAAEQRLAQRTNQSEVQLQQNEQRANQAQTEQHQAELREAGAENTQPVSADKKLVQNQMDPPVNSAPQHHLHQNSATMAYQNVAQQQTAVLQQNAAAVEQPQNIYANLPELHQTYAEASEELPELRQNDNAEARKAATEELKQNQNTLPPKEVQGDHEIIKKDSQIIITRSNPAAPTNPDAQIEASKAEQLAAQNAQRQAALTQGGNATQSTVQNTVTNMTEQVLVTQSGTVISQPQPKSPNMNPIEAQSAGLNQNMTIAQAQAMTEALDKAEAEEIAKAQAQAQALAAQSAESAENSDANGLLDVEDENSNPVPNPFGSSFSTISGVGVSGTASAESTAQTNANNQNQGITLEQQAQMHSRIVAAQNIDDVAADDTPISNPDNDVFEEILDPEKKGINSDLKSAVQNRPSFLSGFNAGLGNSPEAVSNQNNAATPEQNMQTKILTQTVPEDELDDGVVPKDVKTTEKVKTTADNKESSEEFKINAVPSKTPGAAAITNGRSEPIPDPTVVDEVAEIKEKSGFFSKLASIFTKKSDEIRPESQNLQLNSASASAALMAQNTGRESPLDAFTHALKAQINNPALPQVVRNQAKDFLKQLENPINDLPSVTSWLSFTSSPLSTSSSMSLALHQWAFLLLSIRFSQLGKSVDKFLKKDVDLMEDKFDAELKKISKELGSGSRGTISSLIDDTFEQISRMQKPLKENLPALYQYIPLPPSYDGGKEGAFNARPVVEEDGKKSWHLTFVFDLQGIGPIEIKAVAKLPELKLSVIASSVEGLQKVQEALPVLKEQLQQAGITTRSAMARLGNVHIQDTVASPDVGPHERNSDGATLSVDI
ncbi:hypothetical protein SAMN02910357_02370 [Succinivibrio dextrinosolvens]|uniref:hypothetical protein n=1 Tax=Succinivibrio dextrinosolvens TaxID=83771 RepID=UPI0008E7AF5A|nr:hypothetical protein [Succinivibrio dextrinosolvens]SFS88050.1 hypothetical protein SAMN02910357_02370 [Succinivibrio dextrinosolvens]